MTHNTAFTNFYATLQEIGRALSRAARYGADAVATMSWPALAVACLLIAFAVTILPLALFLFVTFMLIKLIASSLAERRERGAPTPYRATDDKEL
ncbi:hypothetical protein KY495_03535 [Massilia sp. PAMC28688]|uniref:hypothetical protein n=1 Tax=Massilia sp. PAMC28688 TaxID=2861283 RepID=UPI001C628FB6|nr:hypothetical protein [Massilia sp. PAMC28688]QYF94305.1 hypothetical protein KY495_03535 [Massilia sp. PAMC28688]